MSKFYPHKNMAFWLLLAFGVWAYCFRDFFSSRLMLVSDALAYYDHTKFYVDNLSKGVFPLWDPIMANGHTNELFLRRIGAYNPIYLMMALLVKCGFLFRHVYLWSVAGYYMLGMVGFYLLSMRLYNSRPVAFAGFLILMFSSLGTRMFDSYIILVTVPLIWFFYFGTVFFTQWQRWAFLGLVLTGAILLTTYIPFYFVTFVGIFLLAFVLVYHRHVGALWQGLVRFVLRHKIMVALSVFLVAAALIPSAMFFRYASEGNISMPQRHTSAEVNNVLGIDKKSVMNWSMLEDVFYSGYFSDLSRIKFAVVFIPVFAFIILGMGAGNRLKRQTVFLFLCAFFLFCVCTPHLVPVYNALYKHVFFFKYFRNLHFFLWFVGIPIVVLFVCDHLKTLLDDIDGGRCSLMRVLTVHALALGLIAWQGGAIWSSYAAVGLSAVFFICLIKKRSLGHAWFMPLLLCTVILVQPLQVYAYFTKNAEPYIRPYTYELYPLKFDFGNYIPRPALPPTAVVTPTTSLYFSSFWYNFIYERMDSNALDYYLHWPVWVYDRVQAVDEKDVDWERWGRALVAGQNTALVHAPEGLSLPAAQTSSKAINVEGPGDKVKLLGFDANHLTLRTSFDSDKFLVYNDTFDSAWRALINGKEVKLYRANIAFKGVRVPAGTNTVVFIYGRSWQYVLNIAVLAGFLVLFVSVIFWRLRERR